MGTKEVNCASKCFIYRILCRYKKFKFYANVICLWDSATPWIWGCFCHWKHRELNTQVFSVINQQT